MGASFLSVHFLTLPLCLLSFDPLSKPPLPPKVKELFVLQCLSDSIFSPLSLFAVVSLPSFHSSLSLSPSLFHCVNSHCPLLTLDSKHGMRLGLSFPLKKKKNPPAFIPLSVYTHLQLHALGMSIL